ncbi:hypothetical protein BJD99_01675 [Rhodococcus sp. 1163]|nr:hypothetical protein BJD99_01675 [Rhodococcus sp. 1163]
MMWRAAVSGMLVFMKRTAAMKRTVAMSALCGLVLFAAACSDNDTENANSTDASASSTREIASSVASEVQGSASAAASSVKATASAAVGNVQDTAYLQALESQDISFGSTEDQVAAARTACDELSGDTSLDATRVKIAETTGLDDAQSRTLINIAVPIYCTTNVGKLTVN